MYHVIRNMYTNVLMLYTNGVKCNAIMKIKKLINNTLNFLPHMYTSKFIYTWEFVSSIYLDRISTI